MKNEREVLVRIRKGSGWQLEEHPKIAEQRLGSKPGRQQLQGRHCCAAPLGRESCREEGCTEEEAMSHSSKKPIFSSSGFEMLHFAMEQEQVSEVGLGSVFKKASKCAGTGEQYPGFL